MTQPRRYEVSGQYYTTILSQKIAAPHRNLNGRWEKVFGWPEDNGDSYVFLSPYGEVVRIDFQRKGEGINGALISVYNSREQPIPFGISELETFTGVRITEISPELDTSLSIGAQR